MICHKIHSECAKRGLSLWVADGKLRWRGKGMGKDLLSMVVKYKYELMNYIDNDVAFKERAAKNPLVLAAQKSLSAELLSKWNAEVL